MEKLVKDDAKAPKVRDESLLACGIHHFWSHVDVSKMGCYTIIWLSSSKSLTFFDMQQIGHFDDAIIVDHKMTRMEFTIVVALFVQLLQTRQQLCKYIPSLYFTKLCFY